MSKKLSDFHYTLCCNELWAKRDHLPDTVRYAWATCQPGSEAAQPQGFQGQGAWLRCLPKLKVPPPPYLNVFSDGGCTNDLAAPLQEQVASVHGQGAPPSWTPSVSTQPRATGVRSARDTISSVITSRMPPARRDWRR